MVAAAVDDDVSESGIQLLSSLGGVLSGATAGFLGAGAALIWKERISKADDEDNSDVSP